MSKFGRIHDVQNDLDAIATNVKTASANLHALNSMVQACNTNPANITELGPKMLAICENTQKLLDSLAN